MAAAGIAFGAGEIIFNAKITSALAKGIIRGTAGGLSNVLSGGKFGHGFVAAGLSSVTGGKIDSAFRSTTARVIASAVVGGTASRITGGKFANGAVAAAFLKAYNELNHPRINDDAKKMNRPKFFTNDESLESYTKSANEASKNGLYDSMNGDFSSGEIEIKYDKSVNEVDPVTGQIGNMEVRSKNLNQILVGDSAFTLGQSMFALQVGHELVHLRDYRINPLISDNKTEHNAYRWASVNAMSFISPKYALQYVKYYESIHQEYYRRFLKEK